MDVSSQLHHSKVFLAAWNWEGFMDAMSRLLLFEDEKTLVDMPLLLPSEHSHAAFKLLSSANNGNFRKSDAMEFISKHFGRADADMQPLTPVDYTEEPLAFLPCVRNPEWRRWALRVHALWPHLSRQVSADVLASPEKHTLMPLPRPMVIPGERFREVYYWDSYWVIRGLLVSKMTVTARGLVENLLFLTHRCGIVPNGSRTYYTNRSQPPLLSAMVRVLYDATGDATLLDDAMPALLNEHKFWTTGSHAVAVKDGSGRVHNLSRYYAHWDRPRPESYGKDKKLSEGMDPQQASRLFREIASAAESGWDFSSRWMKDPKDLQTLRTTNVIPADLNGFLLQMETNVAFFASRQANGKLQRRFTDLAQRRREAMDAVLWCPDLSQWLDCTLLETTTDSLEGGGGLPTAQSGALPNAESPPPNPLHGRTPRPEVDSERNGSSLGWLAARILQLNCLYSTNGKQTSHREGQFEGRVYENVVQNRQALASNFVPLWCGALVPGDKRVDGVLDALESSGLIKPGGIATSLENSGEQWDGSNGWAPLQHMIVEGIAQHGGARGRHLAADLAARWLWSCRRGYESRRTMEEKYDVSAVGDCGSGGEYSPQHGFGWTNGVALSFLEDYGCFVE